MAIRDRVPLDPDHHSAEQLMRGGAGLMWLLAVAAGLMVATVALAPHHVLVADHAAPTARVSAR